MADTNIEGAPVGTLETHGANGIWGPYWVDESVGAIIFLNTNRDVTARKTTDKGASWGAQVVLESRTVVSIAAYFDQQTPGDTGDLIHTVAHDDGTNSFRYAAFDISAGTWGSVTEVGTPGSIDSANTATAFIVKARSGQLVAGCVTSGNDSGCWKAASPWTSWSAITNVFETNAIDQVIGFPANTGSNEDVGVAFWDISANQISVKMYDDSANTWTETAITGTAHAESAAFKQMGLSTRLSDGHVLLMAQNAFDVSTADCDMYDINPTTIATVSFSTLTQVWANQDNSCMSSVFIDQTTNDIYAIYGNGTNPTVTIDIKYKKSTDDGTSWGSAVTYSDTAAADDFRLIGYSAMSATAGRFQPCFFDDDDVDLYVNLDNDIEITSASGTNAPAGNAAGTGAASNATTLINPSAGHASSTGAAGAVTAKVSPSAGHAAATGAAGAATTKVSPSAGHASATGQAFDATVTTGGAFTNAPAELATATGAAVNAQASIAPSAGHASATGAASAATTKVAPVVGHASATAAAFDATVVTGSFTNAAAGTAAATGAAGTVTAKVSPVVGHAAATGAAHNATVSTSGATNAPAGHASATGQAFDATVSIAVSAGHASATALAFNITARVAPVVGHAAATGAAYGATMGVPAAIVIERIDRWREPAAHVYTEPEPAAERYREPPPTSGAS